MGVWGKFLALGVGNLELFGGKLLLFVEVWGKLLVFVAGKLLELGVGNEELFVGGKLLLFMWVCGKLLVFVVGKLLAFAGGKLLAFMVFVWGKLLLAIDRTFVCKY